MVTGIRTLLATLALASVVGVALFDAHQTVNEELRNVRFIAANRSLSYDQKMLTRWGEAYGLMLFVNQATPPDAVIGVPPHGMFRDFGNFPMLWHVSFAYPRSIGQVGTHEAFLSLNPTHIYLFKDFPPYTFPGDPRPLSTMKSFDRPVVIAVQRAGVPR